MLLLVLYAYSNGTNIKWKISILCRKGGLLVNNVLVLAASIFLGCAKPADTWILLVVGRFLIGINSGINAGLAPMYLSEIAPVALRGAVGTVYQLIITISILFSQIMGMDSVLGTPDLWPWVLALTIVPGVLQVFVLPLCPESPKYLLLEKEDDERANEALVWLRGKVDVHDEMDAMKQEKVRPLQAVANVCNPVISSLTACRSRCSRSRRPR